MRLTFLRVSRLLVLVLGAAGVSVTWSCSREHSGALPPRFTEICIVLREAPGSSATGWTPWLNRFLPDARRYDVPQIEEAMNTCIANDATLVVPGQLLQETHRPHLDLFIRRGGRLALLGRDHPLLDDPREAMRRAVGLQGDAFTVTSGTFRIQHREALVTLDAMPLTSPAPLAPGYGGPRAPDHRWIPLVEALGPNGAPLGWAGGVTLPPQAGGVHAVVGWLGFDPPPSQETALVPLVEALLAETTKPMFLYQYGMDRHAAESQTPLRITARIIDRRGDATDPLRIAARWLNANGMEVRRHISPPLDRPALVTELAVGLAPEPSAGRAELYTLELTLRDRNDQRTHDISTQVIKVLPPRNAAAPWPSPLMIQHGAFVQDRMPVFMLGVNYWPRLFAPPVGDSTSGHWLNPEHFHAATIISDLDLMAAAGLNAVAIEYTDPVQAPQLVFVLDELRKRSMWASVYMPSLYPFDLRLDTAVAMLEAIRLETWPELFALELARGLVIRNRADLRRLDRDWSDWIEEHFNSLAEAEQKAGVSFWRERNGAVGPSDEQLLAGPHRDRAVAIYYAFLRDYASRRMGLVRKTLHEKGYTTLLTARSSFGAPDGLAVNALDSLDPGTGSLHLDVLAPDAWTIHPLRQLHPDGPVLAAYMRGISNQKPIIWSAYGQAVEPSADHEALDRQKDVYQHFLSLFIAEGSAGCFAWRYPSGQATPEGRDWGIMLPSGSWYPVEDVLRTTRLRLRSMRPQLPPVVAGNAPLIQTSRGWQQHQTQRTGPFADPGEQPPVTLWLPPGSGLSSRELLENPPRQGWSVVEGLHMLNAEWGTIQVGNTAQPRAPRENIRTYAGRPVTMEIINSGTLHWTTANTRQTGTIWLQASQPGQPTEWIKIDPLEAGSSQVLAWTPREPGFWEIQPHLAGYGKFGERLSIEVTTPPSLF